MNKMVSVPSETKLNPFPTFMSKAFPFLDVKGVLKLLCVNKVVSTDMKAFLGDFRRPYVSLSTPIPASAEDFPGIIETLERSVSDLDYGIDKVTQRLLLDLTNLKGFIVKPFIKLID